MERLTDTDSRLILRYSGNCEQFSTSLTAASSPIDRSGLPTDGHIPRPLPLSVLNPTKCLPVFATSFGPIVVDLHPDRHRRWLLCALAGQGRQVRTAEVMDWHSSPPHQPVVTLADVFVTAISSAVHQVCLSPFIHPLSQYRPQPVEAPGMEISESGLLH
ncbi:hypothetical protein CBS147346_5865 [Aspergillus niger]|nr:hypothetical protein CBS147346_5865 [Aspergillus niger]